MPAPAPIVERRIVRRGLRVLALAIRTQPRPFAVAVIGSAGYAGATVGSAMVFGWATDTVISPAFRTGDVTRGTLALVAAVILAVAVAKAAGIVVRKLGALSMQLRLHAIFRKRVSVQYQRLPLTWHRRHTTGELLSNANADVEATFWPVAPLPLSIGVGVMLIAAFGLLIATDLWLAVVGALVFPAIALVNWRYNRAMAAPATRAQQRRAAVSETAHESFDGALVVKTLGREEAETRRFAQRSEELRDDLIRLGRIRAIFDPLMEALPQTGVLAVIAVAAWRIVEGPLSTGDLVQIAYLFTLLAFPLRVLGFLLGDLPRAVVGWERVERVLAADDELPWGDRAATDDNERPAHLNVREASYHYPVTAGEPEDSGRGITSLDLDASPGRVLALVGPTGSGKSTAVSLLVRLADPDHGVVELDGTDLRSLRKDAAAQQTAISFQHPFLFDDTVRGNITLGASFSEQEVRTAAQLAQADGFITALPDGYDTLIGERGTSLSGGQRQRLALARALVRRPRLLILDDATSSVDPQVEAAILSGLREAALPSTVVIVAYREATIALADEVVYIDGGQVVAHGTHADLLARLSAYAHLVGTVDDGPSARPGHLGAPEAASPSRHDDEPSDDRPSARPGHLGAPEAASPSRRDQE